MEGSVITELLDHNFCASNFFSFLFIYCHSCLLSVITLFLHRWMWLHAVCKLLGWGLRLNFEPQDVWVLLQAVCKSLGCGLRLNFEPQDVWMLLQVVGLGVEAALWAPRYLNASVSCWVAGWGWILNPKMFECYCKLLGWGLRLRFEPPLFVESQIVCLVVDSGGVW